MKILVVEDEHKIASFIKKGLKAEGMSVDVASDGEEGLFMAQEALYDILILDIRLPKLDGISVCQKLRENGIAIPIILLTAKDGVDDRVRGLDAGADDYLTKPFSFSELLARIRAHYRRQSGQIGTKLTVGDLSISPTTGSVTRNGVEIILSNTEFRLLMYLVENKNRVLSKPIILERVWGFDFSPESNIVEVYINYLRQKIDKGHEVALIQTIHGSGYRICDTK